MIAFIAGIIVLGAILIVWLTTRSAQTTVSGRKLSERYFDIDRSNLINDVSNSSPANLICYFSLDSLPCNDSGPFGLTGTSVNVSSANGTGHRKNALSFTSTPSYFAVEGASQFRTLGQGYSISLWIKPSSIVGGTILHISKFLGTCASFQCYALVSLTPKGQIAVQSWSLIGTNETASLSGPMVLTNTWTHLVLTYSTLNGMRLYVDGTLFTQSRRFLYSASMAPNYIYLGSFPWPQCIRSTSLLSAQYYGLLDEFRVYAKEVTASDILLLSDP